MAFDTAFNITWNQRVHKEETAYLKFLESREDKQEKKLSRRAMSDADLMSAVRSCRGSDVSEPRQRYRTSGSETDLRRGRSRGSGASSSILQKAGSMASSPSRGGKSKKGMTVEQMQEHVFNQSMNRYIKDLEKDAKVAAVEQDWQKQKIRDGHQQSIDEKTKLRDLETQNGLLVQEQIEENKGRRAGTRKQFVEAASAHNFPLFTETFISQDEVEQYRKDVKINFRKELDLQKNVSDTLKNILIKKDKIYAAEKMDANIKKMKDDHAADGTNKITKGKEMMRVWDRDIRLKNIKNAILSGKDATNTMVQSVQ